MEKLKTWFPGILIGVVLTAGAITAWNYAEDMATKKMAEKFLSGLKQVEDKVAFAEEFATNEGGVKVSVSTSDASGCDRWIEYGEYYFNRAMDLAIPYQRDIDITLSGGGNNFGQFGIDISDNREPLFNEQQLDDWWNGIPQGDREYISAYLQAAGEMGARYGECMEGNSN